MMLAPHL
jgi:hypothetical protein